MTFDASALASGSDLPHSFPSGIRVLSVVFLSALLTGSGVSPRPDRTLALLAQKEDKRNQNYNPNAQPYLEEPMKKLVKRIPELKGLRPEADQQALPMVLEKSAERVDEFFANIVDLLAHEEITQERLNGIGVIGAFEQVRDSYLILRRGRERGATIGEYRMDKNGNRMKVYLKFKALDPDHRQFYEVAYRNEHHYADYQRYRVSVKMKTPQ